MIKVTVYDWLGNRYKVKVHEIPFKGQTINLIDNKGLLVVKGPVCYTEHTYGKGQDITEVYLGGNPKEMEYYEQFNKDATFKEVDWWDVDSTENSKMLQINLMDNNGEYGNFRINATTVPPFGDDLQVGISDDKRIRGEVSWIDRWISPGIDNIDVQIRDHGYNDGSTYQNVNWW